MFSTLAFYFILKFGHNPRSAGVLYAVKLFVGFFFKNLKVISAVGIIFSFCSFLVQEYLSKKYIGLKKFYFPFI